MQQEARNKGFTLIEVLVVIFIIGLLASVILVGLGTFRARGRDARRIADLRSMQNILELYYAKNGEYPTSVSWNDLAATLQGAGIGVSNIPNDPLSDETYRYAVSSSRQNYVLAAKMEDPDHPALRDDVDGGGANNYGVSCDDPIYCLKF